MAEIATPPELGATAAALLLGRHEQSTRAFGLVELGDDVLRASSVRGYRFIEPEQRAAVLDWWRKYNRDRTRSQTGG